MFVLKSQYISGETILFSIPVKDGSEEVSVVFTQGEERLSFDFRREGDFFVLSVDSAEVGSGGFVYTVWRCLNERREVLGRGVFDISDESDVVVDPIVRAKKNIEILKNARMGIFSAGIKRNKVRDREVERFTPEELLKELKFWEDELYRLELKAGVRKRKNMRFYC